MISAPAAVCRSCIVVSLRGVRRAPAKRAQLHRSPRRAGRRALRLGERRTGGARAQPLRRHHARLALAGTHRDRRVALQQLHRREAFGHGLLELLVGDVHAQAGELLARPDPNLGRQDRPGPAPRSPRPQRLDPAVGVVGRGAQPQRGFQAREPSLRDGGIGGCRTGHRARPRARSRAAARAGTPAHVRRTRPGHPTMETRFVDGAENPASTTRSQSTFVPDSAPGAPTVTPVTRRRPDADRIVGAARDPVALARRRIGTQVDDRDRGAGVDQRSRGAVTGLARRQHHGRAGRAARRTG